MGAFPRDFPSDSRLCSRQLDRIPDSTGNRSRSDGTFDHITTRISQRISQVTLPTISYDCVLSCFMIVKVLFKNVFHCKTFWVENCWILKKFTCILYCKMLRLKQLFKEMS